MLSIWLPYNNHLSPKPPVFHRQAKPQTPSSALSGAWHDPPVVQNCHLPPLEGLSPCPLDLHNTLNSDACTSLPKLLIQHDAAFFLQIPHEVRHRCLRRYAHQHMHMDWAYLRLNVFPIASPFFLRRLSPVLRHKFYAALAIPFHIC